MVSETCPEQFDEKRRLEAPEVATKDLGLARLKFVKRYESVPVNRGWDDYLFWMNVKSIFFQLPKRLNLKECCSGGQSVEVVPAYQVIKKLKIESSVALHACCIPLNAATATGCDKITKGECRFSGILNTCTR